MADRVLDGTPCGPYETDLCVHGKCQVICFPCVFGGTFFGGEAPSPPEVFGVVGGAGRDLGRLGGDGSSQEGTKGALSCKLAPLLPQQQLSMKPTQASWRAEVAGRRVATWQS